MILYDYETSSGRNVIKEYIDSLTIPEMVDGYSVREKMENGEFEKLNIKRWEKKIYEVYFSDCRQTWCWVLCPAPFFF